MPLSIVKWDDLGAADMFDNHGNMLDGIVGVKAASGILDDGHEMGLDVVSMENGSEFPLHTHPGYHILYILKGPGIIHYDGTDYVVDSHSSIFVPAADPHGVKTLSDNPDPLKFIAIGYPYKHVNSTERMELVEDGN